MAWTTDQQSVSQGYWTAYSRVRRLPISRSDHAPRSTPGDASSLKHVSSQANAGTTEIAPIAERLLRSLPPLSGTSVAPPQGRCHFFPPYYKPVPRRLHRDAEWFTQQRVLTGPCFRPTFHSLAKLYTGQSVMPRDARQGDRVLESDVANAPRLAAHAAARGRIVELRACSLISPESNLERHGFLPPSHGQRAYGSCMHQSPCTIENRGVRTLVQSLVTS